VIKIQKIEFKNHLSQPVTDSEIDELYALCDVRKPIGVAEWRTRLVESLPKRLQGKLPTIEQIERELGGSG